MRKNPIDPFLERLKRKIFLNSSGMLASKSKGEGFDFAELSNYIEGMDAKKIFWKSLAKGGDLQIKQFYEERELNIVVALFVDGSLCYGEPKTKFALAKECASLLGLGALYSGNLFQGFLITPNTQHLTTPSKNAQSLKKFLKEIEQEKEYLLYSKLSLKKASEKLFQSIKQKSLIFLIGDFLEEPELGKLAKKHSVVALRILDRFESDPHALGEVVLIDPQSGKEMILFFDTKSAKAYQKRATLHEKRLKKAFLRWGVESLTIYCDEEPFLKLSHL